MYISFSALDAWSGFRPVYLRFIHHTGDLASLAKTRDGLNFPGLPHADATATAWEATGESGAAGPHTAAPHTAAPGTAAPGTAALGPAIPKQELRFVCSEGSCQPAHNILRLTHDTARRYYDGRRGIYEQVLAEKLDAPTQDADPELILFEATILAARYKYQLHPSSTAGTAEALPAKLPPPYERDLLELLLSSDHPEKGFELLRANGFLQRYWPELADLCSVDHAKDFHPEGDAWRHTMETFSHRKTKDPILSLALLLHDIGKPEAIANEGRRFDGHADIGGQLAQRFLRRLGFSEQLVASVFYLVRYHMMPAALPQLPTFRVEEQLRNPLFPVLLELYRCDELSTFRGPDGYYAACAAYKEWCKHSKNPWRQSNGRRQ